MTTGDGIWFPPGFYRLVEFTNDSELGRVPQENCLVSTQRTVYCRNEQFFRRAKVFKGYPRGKTIHHQQSPNSCRNRTNDQITQCPEIPALREEFGESIRQIQQLRGKTSMLPLSPSEPTWYIPLQARDHEPSKRCLAPKKARASFMSELWIMSKKTPGNHWKSSSISRRQVFFCSPFFLVVWPFFSQFFVVWPTKKTAQQSPNLWNWSGEGIRGSRETNGDQDTGEFAAGGICFFFEAKRVETVWLKNLI